MIEKIILPKDKISIAIRSWSVENDEIIPKGDFIRLIEPSYRSRGDVWAMTVHLLVKDILAAYGIDALNDCVVFCPKTEDKEEFLTHNGNIEFEIK